MELRHKKRLCTAFILISIATVFVAITLLHPVWGQGTSHEHLMFYEFYAALRAGIWWPLWTPENFGGLGFPSFVFSGRLAWYVIAFFYYFDFSYLESVAAFIAIFTLLGSWGMYLLLRGSCGRSLSLLGTGVFCVSPITMSVLWQIGDLNLFAGAMLLPWILYFWQRLKDLFQNTERGYKYFYDPVVVLPILWFLLFCCSVPLAVLSLLTFGSMVYLSGIAIPFDRQKFWRLNHVIFMASFVLSSSLYLPYVLYLVETGRAYFTSESIRSVQQVWSYWWPFLNQTSVFQFDLVLLMVGASALFIKTKKIFSLLARMLFIVCFVFLIALTIGSPAIPVLKFDETVYPLAVVWLLAGCLLIPVFQKLWMKGKTWQKALMAFLVLATNVALFSQNMRHHPPGTSYVDHVRRYEVRRRQSLYVPPAIAHYQPLLSHNRPLQPRDIAQPIVRVEGDVPVTMHPQSTLYSFQAVTELSAPSMVTIDQLYFPGWQIWIDGERQDRTRMSEFAESSGLVQGFIKSSGRHTIEARYVGLPWPPIRYAVMILAFCWLVVRSFRRHAQ